MTETITDHNGKLHVTAGKLLSGKELLQIHTNADRVLPKVGLKDFAPSNSWLEKRQIESILDEHKLLLDVERVEKWGSLATASWKPSIKLAEVTKRVGRHFNTMGFEKNGKLYLYPEEALYLLETNSLELMFGGVPMSLQQGYTVLMGSESSCSVNEYRSYSHLVRQGYRVLRPTKQVQTTQYERQIRLDQHAKQKRFHPGDTSVVSDVRIASDAQVIDSHPPDKRDHSNAGRGSLKCSDSSVVDNSVGMSDIVDQLETLKTVEHFVPSNESGNKNLKEKKAEEVSHSESSEEHCLHDGNSNLSSSSDVQLSAESRAYDIAKSLVSLGSDLLKEDPAASGKSSLNMSTVLSKQIIEVLGTHFDNDVSRETLEAVALNATQTILSHGGSRSSNEEKGNEESVQHTLVDEDYDSVSQVEEKSKDDKDQLSRERIDKEENSSSFESENHFVHDVEDDSSSGVETPDENDLLKPESFENGDTHSFSLKRQVAEGTDEFEPATSKKAKLLDVSDSEIEILDVIKENKKVEVIDLSEDDSDSCSAFVPRKSSYNVKISKKEIIDIDDSESGSSESGSSDSSDGSTDNSSDSSIVCIETNKPRSAFQKSAYQKLFDHRRRNILNTFPCMHNRQELTLHAPDPELLPENVLPNYSTYVIQRWKLLRESKQMHLELEALSSGESTLQPHSLQPHSMAMNSWMTQSTPPNFLLGGVPSDPWALMQTLAHLLLPITNQAPHLQRWPQHMPNWNRQPPSWPRQPYFNPKNNWRPRPQGFRQLNARYPKPQRSWHRFPRSSSSGFSRPTGQVSNFNFSTSPQSLASGNFRTQQDLPGDNRAALQYIKLGPSSSSGYRGGRSNLNRNISKKVQKGKQVKRAKGVRNSDGFTASRYFNPPKSKKFLHMQMLKTESAGIKSEDCSEENVKHESSSSEEEKTSSANEENIKQESEEEENEEVAEHCMEDLNNLNTSLLQPHQCTDFASVCRALQVIQRADSSVLGSLLSPDVIKLHFDVYLPTSTFKKGSLSAPNYHLCVMDVNDPVPTPCGISFLLKKLDDGVPLLFAVVHPDSITFLQFLDISLPFQPVDL